MFKVSKSTAQSRYRSVPFNSLLACGLLLPSAQLAAQSVLEEIVVGSLRVEMPLRDVGTSVTVLMHENYTEIPTYNTAGQAAYAGVRYEF